MEEEGDIAAGATGSSVRVAAQSPVVARAGQVAHLAHERCDARGERAPHLGNRLGALTLGVRDEIGVVVLSESQPGLSPQLSLYVPDFADIHSGPPQTSVAMQQ